MIVDEKFEKDYEEKRKKFEKDDNKKSLRCLELGRNFRRLRLHLKKTQQQIADELSITRESWNRIERGVHSPSKDNLYKISVLFSLQEEALLEAYDYSVDRTYPAYDEEEAVRELENSFRNSNNFSEFLVRVNFIWNIYRRELIGASLDGHEKLYKMMRDERVRLDLMSCVDLLQNRLEPVELITIIKELLINDKSVFIMADKTAKEIMQNLAIELLDIFQEYKTLEIKIESLGFKKNIQKNSN